jgi:hypothetical protein
MCPTTAYTAALHVTEAVHPGVGTTTCRFMEVTACHMASNPSHAASYLTPPRALRNIVLGLEIVADARGTRRAAKTARVASDEQYVSRAGRSHG